MSITTAIPSGTIQEWCINQLYDPFGSTDFFECANSSRGTVESDFETICCDGQIIDQSQELWAPKPVNGSTYIDLANLVCCQVEGPQAGGLRPVVIGNGQTCTTGTPTPLASLAATNTANAQIYPVTFTSASGQAPNIGNFLFTLTPYCLWADTAHGIATMEVTVPAASITTLPVGWPDSTAPLITANAGSGNGQASAVTGNSPDAGNSNTLSSQSMSSPASATSQTPSSTKTSTAGRFASPRLSTSVIIALTIACVIIAT